MSETGELSPPYRQIGGQLQPEQIEVWKELGLPASCPVCNRAWKFLWVEAVQAWVCPQFDANCWCYIMLWDMVVSADGGEVWCWGHWYDLPHRFDDGRYTPEQCRTASAVMRSNRQHRVGWSGTPT